MNDKKDEKSKLTPKEAVEKAEAGEEITADELDGSFEVDDLEKVAMTPEEAESLIDRGKEVLKTLPDLSRRHHAQLFQKGTVKALRGRYWKTKVTKEIVNADDPEKKKVIKHKESILTDAYVDVPVYKYTPNEASKYVCHQGRSEMQRRKMGGFAGKGFYFKDGIRKIRKYLSDNYWLSTYSGFEMNDPEVIFVPNHANGYMDHCDCVRGLAEDMLKIYPRKNLVINARTENTVVE